MMKWFDHPGSVFYWNEERKVFVCLSMVSRVCLPKDWDKDATPFIQFIISLATHPTSILIIPKVALVYPLTFDILSKNEAFIETAVYGLSATCASIALFAGERNKQNVSKPSRLFGQTQYTAPAWLRELVDWVRADYEADECSDGGGYGGGGSRQSVGLF